MLLTQTSNLPPEQKERLHADFLANEQTYLTMRDNLLTRYFGQWVAVQDGKVIASGPHLLTVSEQAAGAGGHPYIALVGAENEVIFRVRRVEFAYDQTYQPFPIPRITATYWNHSETRSQTFSEIIPDTGADLSVLPDADCSSFDLFSSPYFTGLSGGVVGPSINALIYRAKVELNGRRFPALIQPVRGTRERIIGRDVLNQERVLFDGPQGKVIVDP